MTEETTEPTITIDRVNIRYSRDGLGNLVIKNIATDETAAFNLPDNPDLYRWYFQRMMAGNAVSTITKGAKKVKTTGKFLVEVARQVEQWQSAYEGAANEQ